MYINPSLYLALYVVLYALIYLTRSLYKREHFKDGFDLVVQLMSMVTNKGRLASLFQHKTVMITKITVAL